MCLEIQSGAKEREQFSRESASIVGIAGGFTPEAVVQHATVCCLVEMRQVEVHPVSLDGRGHAADENYGAIGIDSFDDPDMCQRVV